MSDIEKLLAEIEEACEKATPGPWEVEACDRESRLTGETVSFGATVYHLDASGTPYHEVTIMGDEYHKPDAHFIANARTWLPKLVRIVRDLRAEKGPCCVQEYLDDANKQINEQQKQLEEMRGDMLGLLHDLEICANLKGVKALVLEWRARYLEVKA